MLYAFYPPRNGVLLLPDLGRNRGRPGPFFKIVPPTVFVTNTTRAPVVGFPMPPGLGPTDALGWGGDGCKGVDLGADGNGRRGCFGEMRGSGGMGVGFGRMPTERAFRQGAWQIMWGAWVREGAEKVDLGPISTSGPVPRGAQRTPPNAPPPFFGPGWRAAGGSTHPPTPARHPHRAPLPLDRGGGGWGFDSHLCQPCPSWHPATDPDAYGHTTGNTPEPVRFQKLSLVRPS